MEHIHSSAAHGPCWPLGYAPDVAVVIGAGSEGLRAARTLATCGLKVSVFDRGTVPTVETSFDVRTLLRSPDIRIVGRVDVVEILESRDGGAVRGVRARLHGLHDAEFFADLVVDASGAEPGFDRWRGWVGYVRPEDVDVLMEQSCGLAITR